MVKVVGGFRRKTRHKLKRDKADRGKLSISKYFQKFSVGDKVAFKANPVLQTGMYNPRYHGMVGSVKGMKGRCYEVTVTDGGKEKTMIVHPLHLRRV